MPTIIKTVGTAGRDYATYTLAEADGDNAGIGLAAGDTYRMEGYNDSVFNETPTINCGGTIVLAAVVVTAAAGQAHTGVAGTGVRNARGGPFTNHFTLAPPSGVMYTITDIELHALRTGNNEKNGLVISSGSGDCHIRRMLIHGYQNLVDSTIARGIAFESGYSGTGVAANNVVYYLRSNFAGSSARGISFGLGSAYNNSIHNITGEGNNNSAAGIFGSASNTARNNIATNAIGHGSGTSRCFDGVNQSYNCSSDATATGTGSLTNRTAASIYVSTVVGAEDLHELTTAPTVQTGTNLTGTATGIEKDIDNKTRPTTGGTRLWDIGADQVALTITKSIGTSARNYASRTLWEASLDETQTYFSGDTAQGEGYNDSVFTGTVAIDGGGTVGLAAIHLTVAAGQRHAGVAGTGCRAVASSASNNIALTTTVPTTISWWEINGNALGVPNLVSSGAGGPVTRCHHLILHNCSSSAGSVIPLNFASNVNLTNIHNSLVYRLVCTHTGNGVVRFVNAAGNANLGVYNCTFFNGTNNNGTGDCRGTVVGSDATNILRNNISVECNKGTTSGLKADFQYGAAALRSHNISSDSTADGTGSLTLVTAASLFVSTVTGSEDLHILHTAPAIDAGTNVAGSATDVEDDIDNWLRGAAWDIGADEGPLVTTVTPGTVTLSGTAPATQKTTTVAPGVITLSGVDPTTQKLTTVAPGVIQLMPVAVVDFRIPGMEWRMSNKRLQWRMVE